jgi:hypothetical protein
MRNRPTLMAATLMLLAGSCATAPAPGVPNVPTDAMDHAARAFSAGLAAEQEGHDRNRLAQTVAILLRTGVVPAVEDGGDLVAEWQEKSGPAMTTVPLRGRALGSGYRHARISGSQIFELEQMFRGGEVARVIIAPPPKARLELRVSGREGEICRKVVTVAPTGCSWVPVFTSRHRFELRNLDAAPARFVLLTN